jgi:hypothetical protein
MKHILALLCLLLVFALPAHAQTNLKWNEDQVSWSPSTACSDGSPIADCPVTGYRLETAKTCTATTWALAGTTAPNVTTFRATNLTAGLNCYRVKAQSANGDSAPSSTASATATPPLPSAPVNVTVTDVVAYEIRPNASGVLIASRIGIVPTGAICGAETRLVGDVTYNRVDPRSVDLVNWPAQTKPVEAWAKCAAS